MHNNSSFNIKGRTIVQMLLLIIMIMSSRIHIPWSKGAHTSYTSIASQGSIIYSSRGIHVEGRQIVDATGNPIELKGFNLRKGDIFNENGMPITLERMQQIEGWGFNVINVYAFWGAEIEPFEDQPGFYSEENLMKIETILGLADQAGLYVILSMRIHHENSGGIPSWQGWPTAQMVEDDPVVRQRFYDMWSMLIHRFDSYENLIGYNWWFFPWHEPPWGKRVEEEVAFFYNEMVPDLISITRTHSDKIIFFTPYKQACINFLDTGEFSYIEPIADDNVVYCHGFHRPWELESINRIEYDDEGNRIPWDYDVDYLISQLQPGIDFAYKYNVPMMVTEMGLHTYNFPDVQETGDIAQDRLDLYEAKLSLLEEEGWHWLYWIYSNKSSSDSGVLKKGTLDPFQIINVLRNHLN